MSIEEAIERAKLEAFRKWDEGHKNCDFGSPERGQGMRDGFGDGFEVGFREGLKSLYRDVTNEDLLRWWGYEGDDMYPSPFIGLLNGKWVPIYPFFKGEDNQSHRTQDFEDEGVAARIVRLVDNIPSPSDLFRKEG